MAKDKLIYASDSRKAILKEDPKLAYCIDDIPAVDAVEVVRCKECRHCSRDENIVGAYGYCYHFGCYAHEPMVEADDFCSYGERAVQDGK